MNEKLQALEDRARVALDVDNSGKVDVRDAVAFFDKALGKVPRLVVAAALIGGLVVGFLVGKL
jgi:hypothetical protein